MKATKIRNSIKHTKPHFCASGSLLLPLAQKWGLVRIATCCVLAAFALPFIVTPDKANAADLTLTLSGGSALTVGDFSATGTSAGTSSSTSMFGQASGTITVRSNAYFGYELTIGPKNNGGNTLKNGNNELPSITKTDGITEEEFKSNADYNNTWGYNPSKWNSGTNTKFYPGPTENDVIEKTTGGSNNSVSNRYTITIGAKIDSTLPKGTYANTFVVSVTANEVDYTITYDDNGGSGGPGKVPGKSTEPSIKLSGITPTRNGYEFKGWCSISSNGGNCNEKIYQPGDEYTLTGNTSNITLYAIWSMQEPVECQLLTEVGQTGTITDKRGGTTQTYKIRRLADGRCWMVENLRLGGSNSITLTDEDTDLNDGVTEFALPASTGPFSQDSSVAQINADSVNMTVPGTADQKVGVYYTWAAAVAGTKLTGSGGATSSICPKGWKLPGGPDLTTLSSAYNNNSDNLRADDGPNLLLSGTYSSSGVSNQGTIGYYQSSLATNSSGAYFLSLLSSNVNVSVNYGPKYIGKSVRCVAKGLSSMQKVSEWGDLVKEGDTVTVMDERDGNIYTVRRLADGKLWMVDNLKIAGKTLTSIDSDVSTTYVLPASDISKFGADKDGDYVYVAADSAIEKEEYGGYYSWHAATAGTGTSTMSKGDAVSSICPKGWRLPKAGSDGDFQALYDEYPSSEEMHDPNGPNMLFSGSIDSGSAYGQGNYGYYWSSTVLSEYSIYYLGINSSKVNLASGNARFLGQTVRCVEREKTMQTVDQWGDSVKEGQTVTAIDERDGNTYTVARLADGKLWMTQNLAIGSNNSQTILDPDTSDVANNFTLPMGSTSGFDSDKYDTSHIYIDDEYGGYYTWFAATAGEGKSSKSSGNTEHSICPKGWRLPTKDETGTLTSNSSNKVNGNFTVLAGKCWEYGCPQYTGTYYGYWWSSTANGTNYTYVIYANTSNFSRNLEHTAEGYSVRCVARQ